MVSNPFESRILLALVRRRSFWNVAEISRATGISWNTVEKYLDEFYQRGWVERKGEKRFLWRAIVDEK